MCRKLRICLCGLVLAPPVPPVPPVPPEPPIEYVTRDICIKTGLLALDTCEAIGCVKIQLFIKGDEPTIKCDRHNHWAYDSPIEELHIGGYFYLWQLRIGWD